MNNPLSNHFCCPPELTSVVTVQSVAGIKGLSNCFVHVEDNNTTYYVDNKHNITTISSQVVQLANYDFSANPLNLRCQIAYDTKQNVLMYFDNAGAAHAFDPNAAVNFDQILKRPSYAGTPMTSNTNIPEVPTTITQLSDGNRVKVLENEVETLEKEQAGLDQTVATAVTPTAEVSTVGLTTAQVNLATGEVTNLTAQFPMASVNNAGALTASDYNSLQQTINKVAGLTGAAVAVDNLPESPTQAELTEAWQTASGETDLVNGASINDTANSKTWTYYANTNEWLESAGTSTVALWTVDEPGSIKSGSGDGEVAAQTDGTGKVVGWDEQATAITELQNTSNEYAQSLNQIELDISNLQEEVADLPTGGGMKTQYIGKSYLNDPTTAPSVTSPFTSPEKITIDPTKKYLVIINANLVNDTTDPCFFNLGISPSTVARVTSSLESHASWCSGTTSCLATNTMILDGSMLTGTPEGVSWNTIGISISQRKADGTSIAPYNFRIYYYNMLTIELPDTAQSSTEEPAE